MQPPCNMADRQSQQPWSILQVDNGWRAQSSGSQVVTDYWLP